MIDLANVWFDLVLTWAPQAAALALGAAICERLLGDALPRVRVLIWWAVLVLPLAPLDLASPIGMLPGGAGAIRGEGAVAPGVLAPPLIFTGAALWALGAAVVLAVAIRRQHLRVRALLGGAARDGRADEAARDAARRLGLRRPPEVRVSRALRGGLLVGLRRPVVVVGRDLLERPERLRHVLLHEIAHARRRDPQTALAATILLAVQWFHPAAWLAASRLAVLRELGADRLAARAPGSGGARAYGVTLVALARALPARPGLAFGDRGVVGRIAALTRAARAGEGAGRRRLAGAGLAALRGAAALLVLAACLPLDGPAPTPGEPSASGPRAAFVYGPPAEEPGCFRKRFALYERLSGAATDVALPSANPRERSFR